MAAIRVYFDGQCPICGREVAAYRRLVAAGSVDWKDLAEGSDVLRGESFTLDAALRLLHVRDESGTLHVGLPAHLVLWDRLPVLRWLARGLRNSAAARRAFECMYLWFTARRPDLRRRRRVSNHA